MLEVVVAADNATAAAAIARHQATVVVVQWLLLLLTHWLEVQVPLVGEPPPVLRCPYGVACIGDGLLRTFHLQNHCTPDNSQTFSLSADASVIRCDATRLYLLRGEKIKRTAGEPLASEK